MTAKLLFLIALIPLLVLAPSLSYATIINSTINNITISHNTTDGSYTMGKQVCMSLPCCFNVNTSPYILCPKNGEIK